MRRLRHAVSRPCDAISAVLEPSAVLRLVREHGVRGLVRASAHGARVMERPRRMASYSLGWVSGWAHTARVGRIQLPAHACACERSSARASLERAARVEGRPRAHPRAIEAWRTGCGPRRGLGPKACPPRGPRARGRGMHEGYRRVPNSRMNSLLRSAKTPKSYDTISSTLLVSDPPRPVQYLVVTHSQKTKDQSSTSS